MQQDVPQTCMSIRMQFPARDRPVLNRFTRGYAPIREAVRTSLVPYNLFRDFISIVRLNDLACFHRPDVGPKTLVDRPLRTNKWGISIQVEILKQYRHETLLETLSTIFWVLLSGYNFW
jgi:hypothetical protein